MRAVISLAVALVCVAASAAAQTTGFVYAGVGPGATLCGQNPCTGSQVLVFDAATMALVVRLPLPAATSPVGIAMSPDGSRLYVSNFSSQSAASHSLTEIDLRTHMVLASHPTPNRAGSLAVRGNGTQVFIKAGTISAFDTASHAITAETAGSVPGVMVISAALDRLFVHSEGFLAGNTVRAFDAGSLAELGMVDRSSGINGSDGSGIGVSSDGHRIYLLALPRLLTTTTTTQFEILDAATLASESSTPLPFPPGYAYGPILSRAASQDLIITRRSFLNNLTSIVRFGLNGQQLTELSSLPLPLDTSVGSAVLALNDARIVFSTAGAPGSPHGGPGSGAFLNAADLDANPFNQIFRRLDLRSVQPQLAATPAGIPACRYRLDRRYSSWTIAGGSTTIRLTTGCAWEASVDASWASLSTTAGAGNATLTVTVDPNPLQTTTRTATVTIGGQLVTITQAGSVSQPPAGVIDTPVEGALGLTGSIAVTGWAVDDIGVTAVRLYREPVSGEGNGLVFLGNGTFVEGARPDVAGIFAGLPFATRAGWGYMLLSNMLPNQGTGTFRIHAFADDIDGHTAFLGTRTFTTTNTSAVLPFGTLDTPGQGETVSGVVVNFGWALTPQPANIPADGSTIDVMIDGAVVGHPSFGFFRSDIAALFPGLKNTNSAVGAYVFDSRTLSNGLHTIVWVVRDSDGHTQGIGSRYFTVDNP